jgi:hypothetical protein
MYTSYYIEMSLLVITLDIVPGIMTDAEYNTYFRARGSPTYLQVQFLPHSKHPLHRIIGTSCLGKKVMIILRIKLLYIFCGKRHIFHNQSFNTYNNHIFEI